MIAGTVTSHPASDEDKTSRCNRLEAAAIATNEFELFIDHGVAIQARSPAVQTILIQLAGGGTYPCGSSPA